jgi:hypothetical protein
MASGTDPIVTTNFSCWPWFHQWMQWHDIDQRQVISKEIGGSVGMAIKQERRCCRCNQVQLRTESTTL